MALLSTLHAILFLLSIVNASPAPFITPAGVDSVPTPVFKPHFVREAGFLAERAQITPKPESYKSSYKKRCRKDQVLCYDAVNKCGTSYGGCYNTCKTPLPPKKVFTPPPCHTKCEPGHTLCWDGINECGKWYGGCYDPCKTKKDPTKIFTPPPCPTCTGNPTLCYDAINSCGTSYGGCYNTCKTPLPPTEVFTPPPCPYYTP